MRRTAEMASRGNRWRNGGHRCVAGALEKAQGEPLGRCQLAARWARGLLRTLTAANLFHYYWSWAFWAFVVRSLWKPGFACEPPRGDFLAVDLRVKRIVSVSGFICAYCCLHYIYFERELLLEMETLVWLLVSLPTLSTIQKTVLCNKYYMLSSACLLYLLKYFITKYADQTRVF